MKVLIVHPRDICFDDLEALVFAYENERRGRSELVRVDHPPDHYLAYLLLQSLRLPLSRRLSAIAGLRVDHDFFRWVAQTYGESHLAERKPSPSERFRDLGVGSPGRLSQLQRDSLHALDSIEGRSQMSMRSQAAVPPLALEQLASGVIDYHDPLKAYVDSTADFLNLLHEARYRQASEPGSATERWSARRGTALTSGARSFRKALAGIAELAVAERPAVVRRNCAREGNDLATLADKVRLADSLAEQLLENQGEAGRAAAPELLTEMTAVVAAIHDTLIHDHSLNAALDREAGPFVHVLDANVCRVGREIAGLLVADRPDELFIMISAMSAEQAMGVAVGRALELLGVPAAQIAYGGMSLNAFVPRNLKSIPQAFTDAEVRAVIERQAVAVFGEQHRPSLYFGFFDRPGASAFLDGFLRGERSLGYGNRMALDGFWLDAVKARSVRWYGKYVSRMLGIPFAEGYRPLMIQGSCRYNCDFCASLGSMALGNQRTAEDVFSQIAHDFREMAWVGSNLGSGAEALKERPFFRQLIAGANRLAGGNVMIVDDNLSNVHPWTLGRLGELLQAEGIVPAIWSQMDVNAMQQKEHREFIERYVVSAFVGLEAVQERYLLGFKKKAAVLARKALQARVGRLADAGGRDGGDDDARLRRYLGELERDGETDPLRQSYFVNLGRLADAGAIPLHALLIGVPGHDDAAAVAKEIVAFVDGPVKRFDLRSMNRFEEVLLNLVSELPFMTYQANYFSIFAGSPDWLRFYPRQQGDSSMLGALKKFVSPGYPEYDTSRMGGNFTQLNQNAYRLLLRLTGDKKAFEALGRFEPEDGALAHFYVDRELSRMRKRLRAFFGCLAVTYLGKRYLAPWPILRALQAYKSTIIMNAFRSCGDANSRGLAAIRPAARWAMYRKYVASIADPAEVERAADLLKRFGFEVDEQGRIRMAKLDGYAEGFPPEVYRANGIRDNALADIDMDRVASSYFEAIVGYLTTP